MSERLFFDHVADVIPQVHSYFLINNLTLLSHILNQFPIKLYVVGLFCILSRLTILTVFLHT